MTGAAVGRKTLPPKAVAKLISESNVTPGQPSRFVRERPQRSSSSKSGPGNADGSKSGGGSDGAGTESEVTFCEQLLTGGFVQSYVDFFHLTHRADPSVVDPAHVGQKISVSLQDMVFIRNNLVQAEVDRRQGNTDGVYGAFNR